MNIDRKLLYIYTNTLPDRKTMRLDSFRRLFVIADKYALTALRQYALKECLTAIDDSRYWFERDSKRDTEAYLDKRRHQYIKYTREFYNMVQDGAHELREAWLNLSISVMPVLLERAEFRQLLQEMPGLMLSLMDTAFRDA